MQCVASSAANQRFYFVAGQLVSVSQSLQSSFQLFCRCFPPPSTESAPGGDCRASCAGPCAPRARPFPSPRRGCERWLPRAGNAAATHPGRCGRRRAKAATCKESATLYVAKRRANKPVLPQASCRPQGSPGSGPRQLELPRPLLASEAVPSEDAGFLSHVHTDRPLGRPRGPLLQQHVGLLVAAPPRLCADLVCPKKSRQLLPQSLTI